MMRIFWLSLKALDRIRSRGKQRGKSSHRRIHPPMAENFSFGFLEEWFSGGENRFEQALGSQLLTIRPDNT